MFQFHFLTHCSNKSIVNPICILLIGCISYLQLQDNHKDNGKMYQDAKYASCSTLLSTPPATVTLSSQVINERKYIAVKI